MTRSFLVPLTLPADPATALEAATKQYVDNKAVGGAGAFFQYTFSTTLTAPPASGSIRYNNATPASVTTIYVHYVTNDSTDTKTRLLLRQAGDKLYLQDKDASATYHIFRLTATPTDNGTYAALTVVFDSGAGTFGNNQLLLVGFLTNTIPDGDKGDITTTNSGATWTIDNNAVTTAKLADVASGTIRGRVTAGTGDPQDLTGAQATTLLDTFTTAAKGLVPSPGSTSGLFLKDDGTWAAGGSGGSATGTKLSALATITGAILNALDLIEVLDVSDTTMAASGTNKKITMAELVNYLNTVIAGGTPADDSITNAKLANMATLTLKGNNTGSTADPLDLTTVQATAMLDLFDIASANRGLVPGSTSGGATRFLRADRSWAVPTSASPSFTAPLFRYTFDTTVGGTPGAGTIRLDNATPASATQVSIAATTADSINARRWALVLLAGQTIMIQDTTGLLQRYTLTAAPADNSTYVTFTVTPVSANVIGNGATVLFGLSPAFTGVYTTRLITATAPLRIDGGAFADLAADRTLSVSAFSSVAAGVVPNPGGATGRYLADNGTWVPLANSASNTVLADMPANTVKGNNTGSPADPLDLTVAQAQAMLAILVASETVVGQVELATAAETLTGTDNTRAVHTAGLAPLVSGAGPLFGFLFDTTTTTGTSTSGLRLNNATPASATILYVNYVPREGVDLKVRLLAATAGDRIHIQDRASSANYRIYEMTGAPTDLTTYASLPVVHRLGAGSLWANGAAVVAGFTSPPITIGTVAPTSPLTNDIWIDTT